jgi:prepilin-type N-terminal cleavage/methylation domain-containing protein
MKNFKSSKGFTLIELLIVIAIIGILAAALLVALNPGQRIAASRNARVRSDLVELGNNANLFNTDSGLNATCVGGGSYPNTLLGQTVCGAKFVVAPLNPSGLAYAVAVAGSAANCAPNTANPCTSIAISGPAYADGVVDIVNNGAFWCWTNISGTVVQTTQAAAAAGTCHP